MMKSISFKILRATLLCLVALVVLMTSISVFVVNSITDTDSENLITNVCDKETNRFNSEFRLLENSVSIVEKYIKRLEDENSSQEYLLSSEFSSKVQEVTLNVSNQTDGAMAVYFRYNPELTGNDTQGFFCSRNNDAEKFKSLPPTHIMQYDPHDTEHVGWFYEPKKKHQAMWMTPYYNKNLDVFMISYIIPYYTKSGKFLGVIGMDIDFNKIIDMTDNVKLYESGKVSLVDLSTYKVYFANGDGQVNEETLTPQMYNYITRLDNGDAGVVTDQDGMEQMTEVGRLRNGMRLLLTVPVLEVDAQRDNMLRIFAVLMLIAFTFTAIYIIKTTKRMVHPLRVLTRITEGYAKGDWDEKYISDTNDEIQNLSESISVMAETTKSYISQIQASANTDALTGLKNKNSYLSYIEKFKGEEAVTSEYAVVVFDINFLKKMNDIYGHEMGDVLIKRAGEYICKIFGHSTVFRIGGDEYNVILEKSDYMNRGKLCADFVSGMQDMPPIAGDISLSISYGMASFPLDGTCYDDVFKCADERMYAYKKRMKVGRE